MSIFPYCVDFRPEGVMIGVTAQLTVREGSQEEFERVVKELQAAVKANEPGALLYQCFKVRDAVNTYMFMEQYADQAAVEAHRASEHFKRLGKAMGPCLEGTPVIVRMDSLE
jgi:quinol monooxygenase YgiN